MVVQSMIAWWGTVLPAAMAQPTEEEPNFGMWWGVFVALVVGPIIIFTVKIVADRRRDRRTKELIADSNRDGPVPDLPEGFEPPETVHLKTRLKTTRPRRFR